MWEGIIVMKNNHEVKPLLFIDHPNSKPPIVEMQSKFIYDNKKPKVIKKETKQKESAHVNVEDRTMVEKINYLTKLPKEIPSLKCEIKTNDKVYVGRILNERDHMLEIAMFGRPSETIDKREIEEINIIGF